MALGTGWFRRSGAGGGITDTDGRELVHETGGMADTQNLTSTTSAPGAAATILSVTGLTVGGVYKLEIVIALTGTAETSLANLRLRTNSASIAGGGILPTISGSIVTLQFARVPVGADGKMEILSQGAATAGSIYTLRLAATRVE